MGDAEEDSRSALQQGEDAVIPERKEGGVEAQEEDTKREEADRDTMARR